MTGVYEHALGDSASDLHPAVRERYGIGPDDPTVCVGRGTMDITRGTLALPALYAMTRQNMLFPESGEDVPFTVTTAGYRTDTGHEVLTTHREFEFPNKRRRFDSLTVWDAANERLLDFLGTGARIASELHPRVEGGALVVEGGRQWLRVGARYVPLPGPLGVRVVVSDRYDDDDEQYHVNAVVESPLAGHILGYSGTFTQELREVDDVPDDLQPMGRFSTVPPV